MITTKAVSVVSAVTTLVVCHLATAVQGPPHAPTTAIPEPRIFAAGVISTAYLFFTSSRGFGNAEQLAPLTYEELERKLHAPGNGLRTSTRST